MALTKLTPGSAAQYGFLLRANPATGVIELVSNDDEISNFLPNGSATVGIHPSKLSGVGATAGDTLRFDGTNWVKQTPYFASLQALDAAALSASAAHGLGAAPRVLECYAVCTSNDNGYVTGDRLAAYNIYTAGGVCAIAVYANATTVYVSKFAASGLESRPAAGGASAALDESKWSLYVYASL